MAGDQYIHEDRWAEALPFMQRAVALDATFEPALMHEADALAGLGRNDELFDMARRWTERAPSGAAFRALATAHGVAGRVEETVAAARRAFELDGTGLSRGTLAEALTLAGRYAEVEDLLRPAMAPSAPPMEKLHIAGALATAYAYEGRRREALEVAAQAPEMHEEKKGYRRMLRLELTMGDGRTEAVLRDARELAASVDPKSGKQMAIPLAWLGEVDAAERFARELTGNARAQYDAVVAWKRGARPEALSSLRALAGAPDVEHRSGTLFLLAKVAAEMGRDEEVVRAVEKLRTTFGGAWRSWGWPHALLLAAKAYEHLGQPGKARAAVDEVLAMWKRADPDLPLLSEARAMRGRLAMR
jgi:tetratricopeptide (TPR) repeat protein